MLLWFTKHNRLKETHFTNILYSGRKEEHFGDGVSLSDIEAEWESIEEDQTVVTRASEKGDEERRIMTDGKEVQEEAREADEQDKAGEMKKKGTVEAGKTDEEEVKDKVGEMKKRERLWRQERLIRKKLKIRRER